MSARGFLKVAGSALMHGSGAGRLYGLATGVDREPLVLCYHRVLPAARLREARTLASSAPAMLVSVETLEKQLDCIGRRYRFVSLDELGPALAEGRTFSRPVAAVTFDDGYEDAYQHAMPLLERKGIPAALFVSTAFVGTPRPFLHDEVFMLLRAASEQAHRGIAELLPERELGAMPATLLTERVMSTTTREDVDALVLELRRRLSLRREVEEEAAHLTWDMVRELADRGFVIGSHSHAHRVLQNEPPDEVDAELVNSRRILEQQLSREVVHFAFPGGRYCPYSMRAAAAAGYRYVYTTCPHRYEGPGPVVVPRRVFWERSSAGLASSVSPAVVACQARGLLDAVSPCTVDHGVRPAARSALHADAARLSSTLRRVPAASAHGRQP